MLYNSTQRRCIWPSELELDLTSKGGHFTQSLTVYRESQVSLPGSDQYWPMEASVDEKPVAITAKSGTPQIQLQPGKHRIEGQFTWEHLPESLPVPTDTGLLSLRVDGIKRDHPELRNGQLWLKEHADTAGRTPEDRLNLEVFRRVIDNHPMRVITLLKLEVSGKQREVILGQPLLKGFIPLEINSSLPARLEPEGQLRVQLRSGRWDLEIHALHPDYLTRLEFSTQPPPWPSEEIWSFEAQPALRLVEIEGAKQVDPLQTRLPPAWRSLPAYRLQVGDALRMKVLRRGDPQPEPDKLRLQRDLWLDFDGHGATLRDSIKGTVTSAWRLSVDPELTLGCVTLNGEPQFITQLKPDNRLGVEVRHGTIDLLAEARIDDLAGDLPASGWQRTFQQTSAVLHLPPGWRLLAASGVDSERHSWLNQWTLYDLFLVFVIAAAVGKIWGWRWAVPALITLVLIWHEPGSPRHIWLYLLAATALHEALPEGKYRNIASFARTAGLVFLVVIALPFMVDQARTGLYPQLARPGLVQRAADQSQNRGMPETAPVAERSSQAKIQSTLKDELSAIGASESPKASSPRPKRWAVDPKAVIQTGPGLPSWQWQRIPLNWNGPVTSQQRFGFTLAGPSLNLLFNSQRILLLLLLAWRFADWRGLRWSIKGAGSTVVLLLGCSILAAPYPAVADYPSEALLRQLEQRLTQPPDCLPQCADIQRMQLELTDNSLSARLWIHALEKTAIPLPIDSQQQIPVRVLLNNQPASLSRDKQGLLWMEVEPGQQEVLISARLPNRQQIQLPLPLRPHRVDILATDWVVEGLHENQVPEHQLNLTRQQNLSKNTEVQQESFAPEVLPPFVQVERTLRLDLEWSVETWVKRLSPADVPIAMHIPLLPHESVITDQIKIKDGIVLLSMGPRVREIHWLSRLPVSERIQLTAPRTAQWMELWRVDVGPLWHAQIEGIAPIHHQDQNRWLPTWMPWAGESVTLNLSRPQGVGGHTRTIDQSSLTLRPGQRATDANLELQLRSSQGGRHEIRLPTGAELQSVKIDNRTQPIRQEGETVSLPVHPGEQRYQLEWRQDEGVHWKWQTPTVDLGLQSVNAEIHVQLARDRWILFTRGPKLGPAILFWGEVLVILLVALILGRLRDYSPLGVLSWLLLGIGLSQVSTGSSLLVAGTLFAFGYRRRIDPQQISGSFNLLQVTLILLSLLTLITLFWAVQQGLLGLPEMQIGGNGSTADRLNWYQDRSGAILPVATVYSVPLLVYRLLMLSWALWLAFSLLGWVKWAWEAFSHRGRWIEIKLQLPKGKRMRQAPAEDT
jgi:hypothetical protein